jgi:hypothetical protein
MDVNPIVSVLIILSGVYSCLCFFPKTGKILFPILYAADENMQQRRSLLVTGIFIVIFGFYSLFFKPIFN